MATRLDVQARREALYQGIKQACHSGEYPPGAMLPTVRELGERHGVSANVVFGVIKNLTDEGVLYTVPRVGAFAGRPQRATIEPYLMLLPYHESNRESFWAQAQSGFEDRISQLGGHSIALTPSEASAHLKQNELPPLSGVFGHNQGSALGLSQALSVPQAFYGTLSEARGDADCVNFDDESGGAQATRHLQQNGHRTIAFLAMHTENDAGQFPWSQRRENGWKKAMRESGEKTSNLAFHPQKFMGMAYEDQCQAAKQAAQNIAGREDITAIVAVNIIAVQGMFEAFEQARWPGKKWPAVVCFDAAPQSGGSVVSYLRLPWEEIGREAAQVLWERRMGRLSGKGVQRLVPMRLIPRLSCRSDWAVSSALAQSRISKMALENRSLLQEPLVAAGA